MDQYNQNKRWEITADKLRKVAQFVETTALDVLADSSETIDIAFPPAQGDLKVFPRPAPQHQATEQGFAVLRGSIEQAVVTLYTLADILDNGYDVPDALLAPVLPYIEAYHRATNQGSVGGLEIAFPISNTELRLVFSAPVDSDSAQRPESYTTESGLKIVGASVDPADPRRVTLKIEPMDGAAMKVDVVRCVGVRMISGVSPMEIESPPFIQGIASISEIQKPNTESFPFASRFVGLRSSASCGKDGGVDSNILIDTLGFAFVHREAGGPFNSLKVVTKKHIPGITEAVEQLEEGKTVHVLWAGGEIRNVNGENQLVDTGFMEGSIVEPTVLKSPPSYAIKTAEISKGSSWTIRAKSLQGVVVHFENVTIDSVSEPDKRQLRSIVFHDGSGGQATGLLLHTVTQKVEQSQQFQFLRGIAHQPRAGHYEVIVEMDAHLR
jgi:hypothetical protein